MPQDDQRAPDRRPSRLSGVLHSFPHPAPGVGGWATSGLAAANRLIPKSPSKVVLHSTIDLEEGMLAVSDGVTSRG